MSDKAPLKTEVNNKDSDNNMHRHSTYYVLSSFLSILDILMTL